MKRFILVLISIFIFSCNKSSQQYLKNDDFEYAVLPFNQNEKYPLFANSTPTSLSHLEVMEIEKIAGQKIIETIQAHNRRQSKPDKYLRQYVAVVNENGEKEIWIQCFVSDFIAYDEDKNYWRKHILDFGDGGDSVFSLKVNLSKKIFYDFAIHLQA
ncbi:hypothetical protein [Flavobacterium caeni]|uniref:Lipoprotein n=1 Tax=Flavobacterium caeni TaxID=490189 RepID=A0A1G5KLU0_9FLAO|nr:hypothetical protein [Flavobacterium caeni]SCZ01576.1 hypothetical protein SAMN02927903_03376 [Flavobacterium caeni]